ncbi:hypothetical protein L1887_10588 [Cichorium endivia]|nr:hypothetical protein L1887_10588 [Cichorium endivia]
MAQESPFSSLETVVILTALVCVYVYKYIHNKSTTTPYFHNHRHIFKKQIVAIIVTVMHFKLYLLLYTHLFFLHYSNAFNITTILHQYPSFSIFNRYLSETNVSSEINSRQTITVLAVSNDDVLRVSGKQHDGLDNLMRVHVILDYFDVEKLRNLPKGTTQMTTLFQTTGRALGQQGFLKATVSKTGNVLIGSATTAVPVGAILVNSVAAEPFNISVLHISAEIVPVGMSNVVVSDSNTTSPVEPPTHIPKTPLIPNTFS